MKQQVDAQNAFVETALEHQLILWQTTHNLLQIDKKLEESESLKGGGTPESKKGLLQQIKKLFTIFGSP